MAAKKKWYVYFLIDPRTDAVFYVGKGSGNRCYMHAKNARKGSDCNHPKSRVIAEIHALGLDVAVDVHRYFNNEHDAFDCERELIAALPGLTNISGGQWSPKELAKEKARYLLTKLRSFEEWAEELSAEKRKAVTKVFGSMADCYRTLMAHLVSEIESPSPNVIIVNQGGQVTVAWERP